MVVTRQRKAEEVKDPRWIFAGLILIAIVLAALLGRLIVDQNVTEYSERIEWWKIIISGVSLAVSLFLGSIVAIQAYQYVNRLSHDWKVRHDYAIDRLDRIYGPLWDETRCIIKALEDYYRPRYYDQGREFNPSVSSVRKDATYIQRYEQLVDSHLRLFLKEPLLDSLRVFHESVDEYGALWDKTRDDLGLSFKKGIVGHESLATSEENKRENVANHIWGELSHDSVIGGMVFQPELDLQLKSRYTERFVKLLSDNFFVENILATTIVEDGIARMRGYEKRDELQTKRQDCLDKGSTLLRVLEAVIRNPESALD